MKIVVLVKQVPGSEARIRIAGDGRSIDPAEVSFVVNPYDEYALEAGLQLKEKFGGELTAVSAGSPKAEEALRTCLALGADRAVLIRDEAMAAAPCSFVAKALAAVLKKLEPDLILCGKVSIDQENSAVGVEVAEFLDLPHVSVVSKLEATAENRLRVHREIEGGAEVIDVDLPAVLTANKGLNEPRYASLKGIMAAKKKPLESQDLASLGLDAGDMGAGASLAALEYPPPRAAGKVLTGESREAVQKLVALLRDEAKVL